MQHKKYATTVCHPMIVTERTIKLKGKSGQKNIFHQPLSNIQQKVSGKCLRILIIKKNLILQQKNYLYKMFFKKMEYSILLVNYKHNHAANFKDKKPTNQIHPNNLLF